MVKGLALASSCCHCDLLGLRTTGLQPNSADLLTRLPFALTPINGHPLVLWQARQQQLLVGDPVAGQRWMDAAELLDQSPGEQLAVLCLERCKYSQSAFLFQLVCASDPKAPQCRRRW